MAATEPKSMGVAMATDYAFDVLRSYGSDAQAAAFQFVLDRLELLGVIAWAREPDAIHVTVADGARARIEDLLLLDGEP